MPDIVLRPAAEEDLIEIYHYIADRSDNAETAIGYIRRIRTWWDSVLNFPESGRQRDDLRPGIRILGFERRVVIAYKILASGDIETGRVFYGGQNYEALLIHEDEGFDQSP